MIYQWAHWMLPALQADPVVAPKIVVVNGWEDRGRTNNSFAPSGMVEHHTACMARIGHDPQSCINGILAGNAAAPGPISQLLVTLTRPGVKWTGSNLDPHVVIIAAGRSNHAGSGQYNWGAPSGNGSSIGIEACGPIDGWPSKLIDFRARVTAALLRNRNWGVHQVDTHYGYARPVGRKIDPSGAWPLQPGLRLLDPWSAPTWRSTVAVLLAPPPPKPDPKPEPPPLPKGSDNMQPIQPVRISDTRVWPGPIAGGVVATFEANPSVVPDNANAVALNVAITDPAGDGYLTIWPGGSSKIPNTSCINYKKGDVRNGAIVVGIRNRRINLMTSASANIIVDVTAYWTPAP